MNLRETLQNSGLAHDCSLDLRKAVCNNCDATITYDLLKHPEALVLTATDSMTGEVFLCPNCGPQGADSLDGVKIE